MSKINIYLVSHPSNISSCESAVRTILGCHELPDRICLAVSYKEFPNWEQDLPESLHRLIMTSNRVCVNWMEDTFTPPPFPKEDVSI